MKHYLSNTLAAASVIALLSGVTVAPAAMAADSTQYDKGAKAGEMHDKAKADMKASSKDRMGADTAVTDPTNQNRERSMAMRNSDCLNGFTDSRARYDGMPATERGDFRTLYRAAETFAMRGSEEACQDVVDGMEELREEHDARMEKAERRDTDLRAVRRMEAAVPASELQGSVRASDVIGMTVRNMQDEELGDVEDVVLKPDGSIRFVLIGEGGFLGIGEDWVAVPWKRLRITQDLDAAYLPISEEAFEDAPTVNEETLRNGNARGVPADIEKFYDEHTKS